MYFIKANSPENENEVIIDKFEYLP